MKKPNLVFIQNDHQAFFNHRPGSGARPLRPNFDRLCAEGARFDNAYCVTPMCAPARRTMLTGQYTHEHKQYFNYCDSPFAQTYLEVLRQGGYENYYFGKWHAGKTDVLRRNAECFTCEGYGNPYTTPEYAAYCQRLGIEKAVHRVDWAFTMDQYEEANYWPKLKTGAAYSCEGTWCGEHAVGETITPKESHEAFFLADMACRKLEQIKQEDSGRPFALRVDFWGPHQPFFPSAEFLHLYDEVDISPFGSLHADLAGKPDLYKIEWTVPFGEDNRLCQPTRITEEQWAMILKHVYAHITMLDAAGGLIVDKLRRLGLDENTLIVWTTDHGDSIASNGGHFDKGSHMCEEVMRIPLAMRLDGTIPKGVVCEELVNTVDLPVTLLDAAGLRFAQRRFGRSLLDIFRPGAPAWRQELLCEHMGHGYGEEHLSKMLRWKNYKLIYHHEQGQINELYDLDRDSFEQRNLYDDPAYSGVKALMLDKLRARLLETDDELSHEAWIE